MNVAITGALGHIGSALIHSTAPTAFDDVLLVDNLCTQRYCSLFNLPAGRHFRFLQADIRTADLAALFAKSDVVLHLAALTNAEESLSAPAEFEAVNQHGATRVAEACLNVGARLIFASTTSVYGPQSSVVDEQCYETDLAPQSPYAKSKLEAERTLARYGERGLRFAIVRMGTVFGPSPGMRFHTAINKFCWQAVAGQPLSVWKTALHQCRPYLDVADAARALQFLVATDLFDNRTYNVVTVNATVHEIVKAIRLEVRDLRVEYVSTPIMNQMSYAVSAARLEGAGFSAHGDLRRGIRDTIRLLGGFGLGRVKTRRRAAAYREPRLHPRAVSKVCG